MAKLKISHPKKKDPPLFGFFAAYGSIIADGGGDDPGEITGSITDAQGVEIDTASGPAEVFILSKGNKRLMWVMIFDITIGDPSVPSLPDLTLTVTYANAETVTSEKFDLPNKPRINPKTEKAYDLSITYPAPGQTVCPNFAAYGPSALNNPVSGTCNGTNGNPVRQPPPGWCLGFAGVAAGNNVQLKVKNGVDNDVPININVNNSGC